MKSTNRKKTTSHRICFELFKIARKFQNTDTCFKMLWWETTLNGWHRHCRTSNVYAWKTNSYLWHSCCVNLVSWCGDLIRTVRFTVSLFVRFQSYITRELLCFYIVCPVLIIVHSVPVFSYTHGICIFRSIFINQVTGQRKRKQFEVRCLCVSRGVLCWN